jgi:ABC-type Fe3+-citrate transport system substrate-binding protein
VKTSAGAVAAAILVLLGCSRGVDSKEAIRLGVIEHLSGRSGLDLKSMQVDVTSVSFRQNEADAVVSFRPKGVADASAGMQMQYTLEKKGDRWVVKGKRESGMSPHGGTQPAPPGGPALGGEMPPGHPPMGKSAPSGSGK